VTGTYTGKKYDASAVLGLGYITGTPSRFRPTRDRTTGRLGHHSGIRLVQQINRQPLDQTELSREYGLRVVCRAGDESAVRLQMLNLIRQTTLLLRSIDSRDLDHGMVEVIARVVTVQRAEVKVERIVGKMSLDPTIVAASWQAGDITEEETAEE